MSEFMSGKLGNFAIGICGIVSVQLSDEISNLIIAHEVFNNTLDSIVTIIIGVASVYGIVRKSKKDK